MKEGGLAYDETRFRKATLRSIKLDTSTEQGLWTRSQLLRHVKSGSLNESSHAVCLQAAAAVKDGRFEKTALSKYQEGSLLYDLSKRQNQALMLCPF